MNRIIIKIAAIVILAIPMMLYANEKPVKAPDFKLKNYDGKEVNLADYKGKIVVLEWINQECPFVKYHHEKKSTMKDLAARYKDKNVVWLAIDSTNHQKPEKNKEYAEKNKILYPILDDRSGTVGKAYKATNTPHIFIINTEGNIAYSGAVDNAPLGKVPENKELVNYVDKALEELTSGKTVSIAKTKSYGCTVKYKKVE
ncbi:MAG: redoxin domain-containing protein [Sedimentisphaerales bacterium]|nr:redoxin domain-containing protein [Sedimentisphaerales bacterium]